MISKLFWLDLYLDLKQEKEDWSMNERGDF